MSEIGIPPSGNSSEPHRPPPRHYRLRSVVMAIVTLLLIVSTGVLGEMLVRQQARERREDLVARGQVLAQTLATQSELPLMVGDTAGLERLLGGLRHDPDVTLAVVRDRDRTVLATGPRQGSPTDSEEVKALEGVLSGAAGTGGPESRWVRSEAAVSTLRIERSAEEVGLEAADASVQGRREVIGSVSLLLSTARLTASEKEARWTLTLGVGLAVLAGLLVALPVIQWLLGAFRPLLDATVRIAEGHLEGRIPPSRLLELDQMGSSFNRMMASLQERDSMLVQNAQVLQANAEALEARQTALVSSNAALADANSSLEDANHALARLNQALQLSQDQLRATNDELVQASRLKSNFLASMSHELRTPLNSIIGYAECLLDGLDGPINADQQESLERVHRNGRHLLELINEILDLARIEAGRVELNIQAVDPVAVARDCLAVAGPLVRGKPIVLEASLPDQAPTVWTDGARLRQVLLNLLSNGTKFTERGSVRLTLTALETGVRWTVEDTGRGIPADRLEDIFQEFIRLDETGAAGTGLGLPIARRLMERLGGTLTVRSVVGEGSAFELELPYGTAPAEKADPGTADLESA